MNVGHSAPWTRSSSCPWVDRRTEFAQECDPLNHAPHCIQMNAVPAIIRVKHMPGGFIKICKVPRKYMTVSVKK